MASITSTGIGSGLDVNSIISQLMAVESRPLGLLQQQKTELNTKLSALGKLQSFTSAMRDAASKLASVSLWNQTKATSSDATVASVVSDSNAVAGDYAVRVNALASGQTLTSRAWGASTDAVGSGSLTIELGRWGTDGFAAKTGSSPVSITIGEGETSLAAIRDKINAAGAGVTASIVNDASGARLSLRSTETGAENAFRITASETTDDGDATTGLSALAFDAAGGASQMTRYQSAANASATINGIPVESASNTLEDVVDGVTITLLKASTSDVAIGVKPDDEAVKTAITAFTKAFNDLAAYIRDNSKYDEAAKKGGTLQGDRTAIGVQSQLRGVLNTDSTASSAFSRLSDVGITMGADGTLSVDSTKLDAALAKRGELEKLFAADGTTTATTGFMDRFRDLGAALLEDNGALDSRSDSLNAMIARNDRSQDAMENRLTQTEKRLRKQYEALDTSMAKLSSLSSYLSGQLAALNNNLG